MQRRRVDLALDALETIKPLDFATIAASVSKTNRVLIVEENKPFAGWGAQVAYQVQRELFDELDAPIYRVTSLDVPDPYNGHLEEAVLPNENRVIAAIKEIGPNPKAEDRKAELRARFEEFTRLSDELQDNLDTFDDAHADIRKALKDLVPACAKWPDILKQAADDPVYDFSRKTALDAAESASDEAKKLLESQTKYFAEHKDEAGKSGTGPS